MKKIFLILIFTALLVPFFASAAGTQECIKIRRDIKFEGSNCDKVDTAAAPDPIDDICEKGSVVGVANGTCDIIFDNNAAAAAGVADSMPLVSRDVYLDDAETTVVKAWVTEKWGAIALLNIINTIVDWIFAFLVIFAVFYVIIGAYNILTSSGEPQKVSSGRNYILYAAIGLLVAFIARAIPSLVKSIMGF